MGRNVLLQILKMIGVLLLFALLMLVILSAFPSLVGPVESSSSYTVSSEDSMTASSQSAASSSAQTDSTNADNGDGAQPANPSAAETGAEQSDNATTSQQTNTHTVTQTTTEEMLLQEYNWIVWLGAFLLTIATFLLNAYNRIQHCNAVIPKHAANIVAATEKSDRLISQANRFVDKYAAYEGDVLKTVAYARSGSPIAAAVSAASPAPPEASAPEAEPNPESIPPMPTVVRNSSDFRVVLESYPKLLANQNTQLLLSQLERCEADVLHEKNAYNDTVARYNTEIHTFPFSMLRKALKLSDHICYADALARDAEVTDEMLGI